MREHNGTGHQPNKKQVRARRRETDEQKLAQLQRRVDELPDELSKVDQFVDLPLSDETIRGLKQRGFGEPTEVQQKTIPAALKGRDVLGAAKTGSGKTLSFVVPAIELLYRKRWTMSDGLGVAIISPTRELAQQIFEVVKIVGKFHKISGGIITGGSNMDEEAGITSLMLIVATPGRFQHHLDQTEGFDVSNLQLLVFDEADRLLDMGFRPTINLILEVLPTERQTLLFSATQTKDLEALARMSVKDPYYVSVHAGSRLVTPKKLCQNFTVVPIKDKLSVLYSFLRRHTREKVMVFFATCNQVKFAFVALTRLLKKDGVCGMCLTGKMRPGQRKEVCEAFLHKTAACMFSTDIAARGLDFPAVKWVIQFDLPDDAPTYIHRVGRTARAGANGASLLILTPEEEVFLKRLAAAKINARHIEVNPRHLTNASPLVQALLVQDPDLKANAQKAVVSYLRSIYFQSDAEVFSVDRINALELAQSYGLQKAPQLKFVGVGTKQDKNMSWELKNLAREKQAADKRTKKEKKWTSHHATTIQEHRDKLVDQSDSDDDFLFRKIDLSGEPAPEEAGGSTDIKMSKRGLKKLNRTLVAPDAMRGTHKIYDDEDGTATELTPFERALQDLKLRQEKDGTTMINLHPDLSDSKLKESEALFKETQSSRMKTQDAVDKVQHAERIRALHKLRKERLKGKKKPKTSGAELAADGDDSDDEGYKIPDSDSEVTFVPDDRSVDSYGNVDSSVSDDDDDSEEEAPKPPAKRKRLNNAAAEAAILKAFGT